MNNIMNPFDNDSYFEVKIPLTDEGMELLREISPDSLKEYDWNKNSEIVDYSFCEMIVAFVYDGSTHFKINVVTAYINDDCGDESENYIDLPDDVASYFKTQAILSVTTQFSTMPETQSIINSFSVLHG